MLVLFLLIIFGLGMSYFATQNTGAVHIVVGNNYIGGIPMYILVIGSLLLGIFISWLISLIDTISSGATLHGKVNEIKKAEDRIDNLQQKNHDLEIEVTRLRTEITSSKTNESSEQSTGRVIDTSPSFLNRLSHNIGIAGK
ncbi:MAG TPA: lipopolysaccharide assembly protein LapA domain-containing protein [Candidatus Acidoferrales bacterium]|nr:lipopolysaccharide assembly protein LapA domain-containing protein [Candidatus Acidoferrales bacterium]